VGKVGLTAAGAEFAEGALRKTNFKFEFEISKPATLKVKPPRILRVLCACGGELPSTQHSSEQEL
jgi:hypothetical protein